MDNQLREIYQQVILDHNKSPRNYKVLEGHTHMAEGHNPLCGDHIDIYLQIEEGVIKDISFQGNGCAISKSSASIMTSVLKGLTLEEAEKWFDKFHTLVTDNDEEIPDLDELGKIAVFQGVREFPVRVKCASLAWHTLHAALKNNVDPVTTE